MEQYLLKLPNYEIFGANMTIDTRLNVYSIGVQACKSCQCVCQSCIGGKLPDELDILCEKEIKDAFKELLTV